MKTMDALRCAMAEVDAYYNERGIFQDKFGFGVNPALIVIDMAYGWTDPAYAGGSARLDGDIAAIQELLPLARSKGIPVIHTTSPFPQAQIKAAADFSPKFRIGDQRACEIDERVKPMPGEYIVQDRSEILHEFTLFDLQARFADVVELEEAVGYLRGLAEHQSSKLKVKSSKE